MKRSILSERKKPYIIDNTPKISIFAERKPITDNNLIVQGTCFGLFEPGQMTQDIENLKITKNWNDINHPQNTIRKTFIGNDNKIDWNDCVIQKGVTFNIEKGILEAHWWNDIHLVDDQPFVCYYNRKNKDKYILEQESLWFLREKKNGYRTLEGGLMLDTSEPYSYGSMIIKRCIPQALDYDKWYKEATERHNKYL